VALAGGACTSARVRENNGTGSGFSKWAMAEIGAGPKDFPEAYFYFFPLFFFSFFCFLVSFISFSNLVQIDSNQLVKISKIQRNKFEQ
jgi:hypothetical protein